MKRTGKRWLLICTALLCAAMLCGCKSDEQIAAGQPQPTVISPDVYISEAMEPERLTVSGTGEVTLAPDMATVYIAIHTVDADAAQAQEQNAQLSEAVLASLRVNGVGEADIETRDVSIEEMYDYDSSAFTVVGYSVHNVMEVTLRDVGGVSAILSDAIAAGATEIYGLSFTVSDSTGAYEKALQAAIADAQGKAAAMAEALGVTLAPTPLAVDEISSSYRPYQYGEMDEAVSETLDSAMSILPISAGELSVTAQVSVAYAMVSEE